MYVCCMCVCVHECFSPQKQSKKMYIFTNTHTHTYKHTQVKLHISRKERDVRRSEDGSVQRPRPRSVLRAESGSRSVTDDDERLSLPDNNNVRDSRSSVGGERRVYALVRPPSAKTRKREQVCVCMYVCMYMFVCVYVCMLGIVGGVWEGRDVCMRL